MHVKSLQSCLTLCDPMDCNLPGSSFHGILQARILEWVVIPFSRGSFPPRDWTCVLITYTLPMHSMYTAYSIYALYVHCIHTIHTLYIYYMHTICYRLNVSLQNSHIEPNLQGDGIRRWGLWDMIRPRGRRSWCLSPQTTPDTSLTLTPALPPGNTHSGSPDHGSASV